MKKLQTVLLASMFTVSLQATTNENRHTENVIPFLENQLQKYTTDSVEYEINNGVLTLHGELPHLLAKEQLIAIAKSTHGIRSVIDLTEISQPESTSRDIPHEVISLLSHNALIPPITVTPTWEDGVLTLRGHVRSLVARDNAIHVAKSVPSVAEVRSQIAVASTSYEPNPFINDDLNLALDRTYRLTTAPVDFVVNDGTVQYYGKINSTAEVETLRRLAKDAGAVSTDTSQLEIVSSGSPSDRPVPDDAIAEAITEALDQHPDVTKDLAVTVEHGIVTLKGLLDPAGIEAAETTVMNTPGVEQVKNHLAIPSWADNMKATESQSLPDPVLAKVLEEQFEHNPYADPSEISWEVNEGVVTLTGRVPDLAVASLIRQDAELSGAEKVINKLVVDSRQEENE